MPCLNEEWYMKVVLASKNKHKLVEISQITEKFDIQLVLESELGVDIDVEETPSCRPRDCPLWRMIPALRWTH